MTRYAILTFSTLAIVALAASAGQAQQVTLSLDLFYSDNSSPSDNFPDASAAGTWQLYALSEGEGLAAAGVQITGMTGSFGTEFEAPTPAFKEILTSGAASFDFDGDQDNDSTTLEMLFAQIPVAAPGPQDLQYGVGVNTIDGTTPEEDELGVVVDISGTSMTNAVLLAFGTFGAGSTPTINLDTKYTGANVFMVQGTATDPPPYTSIVSAGSFVTQTRNNLSTRKGDVNLDFFVDGSDFGDLSIYFDGGVATDRTWQQGDLSGDKRVDASDIGLLFGSWTGDHGPAGAGEVTAHYDPATGEIEVDINGVVNWYVEDVGGAAMTGDAPAGLPQAPGLVTDNDTRIGESAFAPFSYSQNLGNVAATGLANDGSLQVFWNASLGGELQSAAVKFVPEPTTLALAGLALCGVLATRRRAA